MAKQRKVKSQDTYNSFEEVSERQNSSIHVKSFNMQFKNSMQELAYTIYQQHDVMFLLGPAGTGKSWLSVAFAISDLLNKSKKKIVLTRPIVEAGENLGFLPGTFDEKVNPYMIPLFDCMDKMCGRVGVQTREYIKRNYEVAPLAYLRGRTLDDSVCILDEAQNCTKAQLKLFLTRLGNNSKMIITGDPNQSDLPGKPALVEVANKLETVFGVGIIGFKDTDIVRHPLVGEILKRLEEKRLP